MAPLQLVAEEAAKVASYGHPRDRPETLNYGTAGFRAEASRLDHVLFRMGILAALRSKKLGGKAVGVMVTASHNPACDNGVKLVEPLGEMLPMDWEGHATVLANVPDEGLAQAIIDVATAVGVESSEKGIVIVGRDSRESSPVLALAVCDGVGVMRPAAARSLGLTTTPQLHYVVRCMGTRGEYGVPSVLGYEDKYITAFSKLTAGMPTPKRYVPSLTVDCANSVGGVALNGMLQRLKNEAGLQVRTLNLREGRPNEGCGADFVKSTQKPPAGVQPVAAERFASVDGDADRLVYFFFSENGTFQLLDGDRIGLLLSHYVVMQLKEAGITGLQVGLVQTAYANGASTACAVSSMGEANVLCAKTGVKHCHALAVTLDVGAYFEANGHGTLIFSPKFVELVTAAAKQDGAAGDAAKRLLLFRDVVNEAVGDAISGILAVETVLRSLDWSCEDWLAMYTDLPNRLDKVVVADRYKIETTSAERTCVKPDGLQAAIDELVAATPSGRSFVRASGTEDLVRVYAEAATNEALLKLAQGVIDLVYERAGGVGPKPQVS